MLLANLSHNKDDLFFTQSGRFIFGHQVKNAAISTEFKKDVDIIAAIFVIHVGIKNFKKIGMIRQRALKVA